MYPNKPNNSKQKAVASVLTLLAVVIIAGSVSAYSHKNAANTVATSSSPATTTSGQATTPGTTASTSTTSATTSSSGSYKDGTYSATSDYYVPNGNESIKVTLTVANGVVTNSQVMNSEYDRESAFYQEEFASQYKRSVVGKKLSDIQLSYVAGASDTTQGFDDALSQIRNQAQA